MSTDRRTFLQLLTTGALSAASPPSIARALAILAFNRTGTINDVEHICHYDAGESFIRSLLRHAPQRHGYGDHRAVNVPNGDPVWYQPNNGDYLLPFHPGAPKSRFAIY